MLLLCGAPPTNSDEAMSGLAAMHIAAGGSMPVFFYGQHYLGTGLSLLAAPLFAALEPSVFLLRLPALACYAVFLVLMFRLARNLFTPCYKAAGVSPRPPARRGWLPGRVAAGKGRPRDSAVLRRGSPKPASCARQADWVAVATVGFLAFGADRVVKNELIGGGGYPETLPMLAGLFLLTFKQRLQWWAFGAWGVLFGLVLWTHWLAAPYLFAALVVLVWRRFGRGLLVALAGVMIGASPLIWHDFVTPLEDSSVATFLKLASAGGEPPLWDRVYGGVVLGLPMASGLCAPGSCGVVRLWWAPVYLVLLVMAGLLARRLAVWALVGAAGLTVVLYAGSAGAAESPVESARYLHYLLVSTPVWVWALFRVRRGLALVALVAVFASAGWAMVGLARKAPEYAFAERHTDAVVRSLEERGVTAVYGGYWTCGRLVFASRERIACAVVEEEGLRRGFNRYPQYWERVQRRAGQAGYLVVPGSAMEDALRRSGRPFEVTRVEGYLLYAPGDELARS